LPKIKINCRHRGKPAASFALAYSIEKRGEKKSTMGGKVAEEEYFCFSKA